jgi:hypothetical protein
MMKMIPVRLTIRSKRKRVSRASARKVSRIPRDDDDYDDSEVERGLPENLSRNEKETVPKSRRSSRLKKVTQEQEDA